MKPDLARHRRIPKIRVAGHAQPVRAQRIASRAGRQLCIMANQPPAKRCTEQADLPRHGRRPEERITARLHPVCGERLANAVRSGVFCAFQRCIAAIQIPAEARAGKPERASGPDMPQEQAAFGPKLVAHQPKQGRAAQEHAAQLGRAQDRRRVEQAVDQREIAGDGFGFQVQRALDPQPGQLKALGGHGPWQIVATAKDQVAQKLRRHGRRCAIVAGGRVFAFAGVPLPRGLAEGDLLAQPDLFHQPLLHGVERFEIGEARPHCACPTRAARRRAWLGSSAQAGITGS
ncbi:hypothetical protein [Palleronia salina]|uniref:hypothetical protein n=1 Tax=Palleronia salina TaxID=313368 RepID=UPI0011149D1A|nr:hypothetical protein [Palleronia salina]